ncbi:unnamed protein product [Durusdinium trenchii]|uniref:Uncharacterized protein n=1 Tax=Durusdinium trenchii TaxID=1381693 RepID=A0ABP0JR69_9DINO
MPTAPGPSPQALRTRPSMKLRPRRGFLRMNAGLKRVCVDPKHLANLIRRKCGCQSDCYASFRSHSTWAEWMKIRKMMANMSKLEKDDYVFKLLRDQSQVSQRGERHLQLLGHKVCNRAWMSLLGVGKGRFRTLALPQLGGAVGRSAWPAVPGRCLEVVMVKRKSNGSEPAAAQPKATKKGSTPSLPADALQLPHIRLFDQWATYSSEADLHKEGASLFLRPYQLPHRIDYGLRGTSDGRLFLVKGFNRSIAALGILWACYKEPALLEERQTPLAQSYWIAHPHLLSVHTQPKFVNHDGLAEGLLNHGHCSASGFLLPWKQHLTNSHGLLNLMIHRVEMDWVATTPKMRKPWNIKDLTQLQRVCGGFLACLEHYRTLVPLKFHDTSLVEIHKAFEMRHADADILQLLEQTVPPADVTRVGIFAQPLAQYSKEASLDYKHINDRYHKGKCAIESFMAQKHQFLRLPSLTLAHGQIVQTQANMGSSALTILVGDFTLWPSRPLAVDEAVTLGQSVGTGNPNTLSLAGVSGSHHTIAFMKSKSLLGTISGVERSRVSELQNPDPDKQLAPHWRVQQRGISATKDVLLKILDGMNECDKQKGPSGGHEPLKVLRVVAGSMGAAAGLLTW